MTVRVCDGDIINASDGLVLAATLHNGTRIEATIGREIGPGPWYGFVAGRFVQGPTWREVQWLILKIQRDVGSKT